MRWKLAKALIGKRVIPRGSDPRRAGGSKKRGRQERKMDLLWTIAIILVILWLLGMVSSYTLGGFVHILLVLAIIVVLIRVIQGRRPV
jgi:Family of unknown function (DUF5670)